jgi:hypothetical protein
VGTRVQKRKELTKVQIRTALAIGTGLAIGIVVGACINDDSKCEAMYKIRIKLIKALGGEMKKYTPPKPTTYYAASKGTKKKYKYVPNDRFIDDLLNRITVFSTYEKANKCKEALIEIINEHGSVSVFDLAGYLDVIGKDFTMDGYGWTREDIDKMVIREMNSEDPLNPNVIYVLDLPKPKNLKY